MSAGTTSANTLPVAPQPPCTAPRCTWTHHGFKHTGKRGLKPEHTISGPAKYLATFKLPDQRALETQTVATGKRISSGTFVEYLRELDDVIGYDRGAPASLSYVECSGGQVAGRSFHGRPVIRTNPLVRNFVPQPTETGAAP